MRTYVSVDGGMSDNIRPALYAAQYHARSSAGSEAGPCSRGRGQALRERRHRRPRGAAPRGRARGDLLAVPATGAYGRSMASNYNL
nr:hypothetical protein [Cellulosimicrobium sp. MM]